MEPKRYCGRPLMPQLPKLLLLLRLKDRRGCMCVCVFVGLFVSVCRSMHMSVCLSVCLSMCMSADVFRLLSQPRFHYVCALICLHSGICPYVCLRRSLSSASTCMSVSPCLYLSVWLVSVGISVSVTTPASVMLRSDDGPLDRRSQRH